MCVWDRKQHLWGFTSFPRPLKPCGLFWQEVITTFSFSLQISPKKSKVKFHWWSVFCSPADMLLMGEFHSAFVGVDVPETLKLPLLSGSWSPCFLQCGHPTAREVQTMAFHCCWMQIDIVCREPGLNLFVVCVPLPDKWTQRWRGIVQGPTVWVWFFFSLLLDVKK